MKNNSKNNMIINLGPEKPLNPTGLSISVELEGEKIVKCTPQLGLTHRGLEKAAQDKDFSQYLPLVEKIDYLSAFFYAQAYLSALEGLSGIELPKKAQYIRVLTMELNRISSHLLWFGAFLMTLGTTTPVRLSYKLRDEILNIFEKLTGGRMSHNYYVFGGVKHDIPVEFLAEISTCLSNINKELKTLENMAAKNPIFTSRTMDIGVLNTQNAFEYSITGVNLRASGYNLDFRKEKPYLVYNELEFPTPTAFEGDVYSRYLLRIEEIKISINLVNQCIDWLLANEREKYSLNIDQNDIKPSAGRAVTCTESARGLVMCCLSTDGNNKAKRLKWRTPSFYTVQALGRLVPGHTLEDLNVVISSLDIVISEADR